MNKRLPSNIEKIFWDIDLSELNPSRHSQFIIERILEYGDETLTRWLFQEFSKTAVASVVKKSRRLSPKSKYFWRIKLGI